MTRCSDARAPERRRVTVDDYVAYQTNGYLIVRKLFDNAEVEELAEHAIDILHGRSPLPGLAPPPDDASLDQLMDRMTRIHMLHRVDAVSEKYFLHPRVLDVLEALTGPDVLALQTMLFLNPPGRGGQGWHQDSFYILTFPDTLIGVWTALDRADEENGCLWVSPGSHREPVRALPGQELTVQSYEAFADLEYAENVSVQDDSVNSLTRVAGRYPRPVPVVLEPGDAVFFHGHLLHRSYPNRTADRWRRAFVCHYCNARSWVPWNHGAPFEGDAANGEHILARGRTHLPFALPRFGTPCAALELAGGSAAEESKGSGWNPEWARSEDYTRARG